MKTDRHRPYFQKLYFHLPGKFLCLIFIISSGISCKEKQKPPDFKKDVSGTVLFKKALPVSVERIARSSFQRFIKSTGVIKAGPMFPVNSLLTGLISHLPVEEGQNVKQHQLICELDQTPFLMDLQYQTAIVEYMKERFENIRDRDGIQSSEGRELVNLLQAEEVRQKILENRLENISMKSPINGRIRRLFVRTGEVVSAGASIAEVIDLSQVTVLGHVHQEDLPYLEKGMRAEIRLSQDLQQVFLGEVIRVALEADPKTHRFGLEISLVNLQKKFLPGMVAQIKIRGPFMKNVLLVPKSAVRKQDGEFYVFVMQDSRAESRKITIGPESERKLIVHSGLKGGEQVIISSVARLNDGDQVEVSK